MGFREPLHTITSIGEPDPAAYHERIEGVCEQLKTGSPAEVYRVVDGLSPKEIENGEIRRTLEDRLAWFITPAKLEPLLQGTIEHIQLQAAHDSSVRLGVSVPFGAVFQLEPVRQAYRAVFSPDGGGMDVAQLSSLTAADAAQQMFKALAELQPNEALKNNNCLVIGCTDKATATDELARYVEPETGTVSSRGIIKAMRATEQPQRELDYATTALWGTAPVEKLLSDEFLTLLFAQANSTAHPDYGTMIRQRGISTHQWARWMREVGNKYQNGLDVLLKAGVHATNFYEGARLAREWMILDRKEGK